MQRPAGIGKSAPPPNSPTSRHRISKATRLFLKRTLGGAKVSGWHFGLRTVTRTVPWSLDHPKGPGGGGGGWGRTWRSSDCSFGMIFADQLACPGKGRKDPVSQTRRYKQNPGASVSRRRRGPRRPCRWFQAGGGGRTSDV